MSTAKQLQTIEAPNMTAMELVSSALSQGASHENIDKLVELVKFNDDREAVKAFNRDFTAAQSAMPVIKKTKKAHNSMYAPYDQVVAQLRPVLDKHGLSFRHEMKEITKDNLVIGITVKCILAHREGHSVEAQLTSTPDNSGSKNTIQAIGSAVSYLKRYTLEAVTGVSTSENADDDGNATGSAVNYITEEQVKSLENACKGAGLDEEEFLQVAKVNSFSEIRSERFNSAMNYIKKRAQQ